MAKKDKKNEKPDTKGKADKADAKEKVEKTEFKFGVDDIADKLDIKPASVRVQLRNKGIEKAGKSYGWNTKAELDEVIGQLKAKDDDGEKAGKKDKKSKGDDAADGKKDKKKKSKKD